MKLVNVFAAAGLGILALSTPSLAQKKSKKGKSGVYSDAVEIFEQMNKYAYADELFRKEYTALRSLMNKRI